METYTKILKLIQEGIYDDVIFRYRDNFAEKIKEFKTSRIAIATISPVFEKMVDPKSPFSRPNVEENIEENIKDHKIKDNRKEGSYIENNYVIIEILDSDEIKYLPLIIKFTLILYDLNKDIRLDTGMIMSHNIWEEIPFTTLIEIAVKYQITNLICIIKSKFHLIFDKIIFEDLDEFINFTKGIDDLLPNFIEDHLDLFLRNPLLKNLVTKDKFLYELVCYSKIFDKDQIARQLANSENIEQITSLNFLEKYEILYPGTYNSFINCYLLRRHNYLTDDINFSYYPPLDLNMFLILPSDYFGHLINLLVNIDPFRYNYNEKNLQFIADQKSDGLFEFETNDLCIIDLLFLRSKKLNQPLTLIVKEIFEDDTEIHYEDFLKTIDLRN